MNKQTPPAIPAQNFAVSRSHPLRLPPPFPMPVDFDRLQAARDDAWRRWWELYCAPDVWTNTDAKHAMCLARLEYQDAVFEIAAAYDALPFLDTE